jgi:transcriptional regulator with XRE-family HTH domain
MPDVEPWRARLRQSVEQSGRKHSFIAEEAGISPATLSRILTGRSKRPAFVVVVNIARATGEAVGWLLEERNYALGAIDRQALRRANEIIAVLAGE